VVRSFFSSNGRNAEPSLTSPLYQQFDHLILKDGILFREVKNDGDETMKQLVLPTTYVNTVLQSLHIW
jgi:hypothetical protein